MSKLFLCLLLSLLSISESASAQLPPAATSVHNFLEITITGISPAPLIKDQQIAISYSVSTSILPISGSVKVEFNGQVVESKPLNVTRKAPTVGTLYLVPNQAGSGALTVSFVPPRPSGCDSAPRRLSRKCFVSALSSATQTLNIVPPTVHVRIAGTAWAKLVFKDSRDGTSTSNGYQCVTHDPGCGWWGNDGVDKYFSGMVLPPGASIEGVEFDQFWPTDVDSATGSGAWTWFDSSGTYYAHISSNGGASNVKWNNTCAASFGGKPLNYSISFLIAMPEGTNLGEATFDPNANPHSTCAWNGYAPDPVAISPVEPGAPSGWSGQVAYCNATPSSLTTYLHIRAALVTALPGAQGQATPMIEDNIPVSIPAGGVNGSIAPFSTKQIYQQGLWKITSIYVTPSATSPPNVVVKNPQSAQNMLPMQSELPGPVSSPQFDFRGGSCL